MSKATGIIEGFVAVDPRINTTQSGKRVANITVAHTPQKRDGNGGYVDAGATTWFEATMWEDQVDSVEDLRKGDVVRIVGELEGQEFEKRDGTVGFKVVVKFASVGLVKRGGQQTGPGRQQTRDANPGQGGSNWGAPAGGQQAGGFDDEPPF